MPYMASTQARASSSPVSSVIPAFHQGHDVVQGYGIIILVDDLHRLKIGDRPRFYAWINTDTDYDSLGRVKRRSEPHYAGATDIYWTAFEYDLLGRVVQTVLPDATALQDSEVTVTYAGRVTTTTNSLGQTQTETRNALDEVIRTADHAGTTVTHGYNAWGQVTSTTTAGTGVRAVTTALTYDGRGRRKTLTDPDRGALSYDYNGFDELLQQTDARDHYRVMTYDGLGRLTTRKDYKPGATANAPATLTGSAAWTWDGTANGSGNSLGQLVAVEDTESDYTRTLTYDSLGRVAVTAITPGTGADTYYEKQTYDGYGRPYQRFDAARTTQTWNDNVTEVKYNDYGYAHKWVDGVYANGQPKATYREITGQDARGNVTAETLGARAVRTTRTVDAKTGRLTGLASKNIMEGELQDLSYTWDVLGNLTTRTDMTGSRTLTETFTYDTLNRLTQSQVGSNTAQTVTYDALGNIKSKTGVGSYTYGAGTAGPHAVTTAGSDTYTYDDGGNQLTGAGRTLAYTTFNKVSSIVKGNHTVTFAYGPARARYQRTDTDNKGTSADTSDDTTTTTLYVGSVEKVSYASGTYEYKRYIAGGVALITHEYVTDTTMTTTETVTKEYLLRDHLGSVSVLTDALGTIVQELSYGPWGQRRHAATWGDLTALARMSFDTSVTTRGYTGHEMVDAVGIIHMNGRIYDPKLGRFMQADPVIQFPDYSQSHNRYSYVLNNPLAHTDPSGYFIGKLFKKVFRKLVGIAVNGIFGELLFSKIPGFRQLSTLASCALGNALQCAGATAGNAYAGGASLKRALKSGLFAYVSAQAFTAVGDAFAAANATGGLGHLGAHALTGGILAELQGGEFGHGFAAAGVAFGVGQLGVKRGWSVEVQFVARVVSAGTVSEITGGKFANGATTAAFAFVYNELTHRAVQRRIEVTSEVRKDGEHYYRIRGMICRRFNECSAEYESEVRGTVYRNDIPFTDDDMRTGVHNLPGGNPIRHEHDIDARTSINYTREGHIFHPGSVTHKVHFEDNVLYYDVIGEGTGMLPRTNNFLGRITFRPGVHRIVKQYGR